MVCKPLFRPPCRLLRRAAASCAAGHCAFSDTAVWTVQTFILAAVHSKLTTLGIVGVYLYEPISTSPEDPQILQVRVLRKAL